MAYHQKSLDEHLANDGKPKRILSIDGGGLKGVSSLGILQKIEDLLRKRHNNSDAFCLGHYFDLIAGTSTGAVIAATLATGMRVSEVLEKYMNLGHLVFEKAFLEREFCVPSITKRSSTRNYRMCLVPRHSWVALRSKPGFCS